MKFGYWKIRGLGQVPRLVLAYTGQEFTEEQYEGREKWFDEDKKNLGIEFPNLPYLIDGDFKLTQSKAIIAYVVMKSGKVDLFGKDLQDKVRCMQLGGVFEDGMKDFGGLFWNPKYEELKEAAVQKLQGKLEMISKFIGEKDWAMGYPTICDFAIA